MPAQPLTPLAAKPHREFFAPDLDAERGGWRRVPSAAGVIEDCVLASSLDPARRTGSLTRLVRWHAGALIDRPVVHDFHEEVLVLQGTLVVGCDAEGHGGVAHAALTFACRPPGALHGPFCAPDGCLLFEIQSYHP